MGKQEVTSQAVTGFQRMIDEAHTKHQAEIKKQESIHPSDLPMSGLGTMDPCNPDVEDAAWYPG